MEQNFGMFRNGGIMERFMWPVHSSRERMLACYERFRLGHYANAFRDLSYNILRNKDYDIQMEEDELSKYEKKSENESFEDDYLDDLEETDETMNSTQENFSELRFCKYFEEESIHRLGQRMRDTAEILDMISKEQCSFESPDLILRKSLEQLLKKSGFELYDILVIGREHGHVEYLMSIKSRNGKLLEAEDAAGILSKAFGQKIIPTMNCPLFVSGEFNEYLFESVGKYCVIEGQAGVCKHGEHCSGDNYSFLKNNGIYFCMLSDGCGVGEEARRDSGNLLDLAENYLESGFQGKQMLGFLEGMMLKRFRENRVPSLDYLELDLNSGNLKMAKFGSGASLLWHNKKLDVIDSQNLLLGYEELSEIIWHNYSLQKGDLIILMSDGVSDLLLEDGLDNDLEKCLADNSFFSPASLAQEILDIVVQADDGKPHDDMTVLVLKIG